MIEYSVILSSLVIELIILNIILCKKLPLFATILLISYCLGLLMKVADPTSYDAMIKQLVMNEEKDDFLFAYSIFILLVCLFESIIIQVIKIKKVNNGLDKQKTTKNISSKCLTYFNSLQEALIIISNNTFYFNDYAKSYYLHSNRRTINGKAFKELMHENDINLFNLVDKANVNFRIINYRTNSFDWFESCFAKYQGKDYCVIRKVLKESYASITIGDFELMNKKIEELKTKKTRCGIIIIKINNLLVNKNDNLIEVDDEILRVVITTRYLLSLRDYLLVNDIYKLSSNEFGFILEDNNLISYLINKIKISNSLFTDYSYFIDDATYKVMTDARIEEEINCVNDLQFKNNI